jgi:hypothetical protein
MTGLLNPDLVTRARALARILVDAGYAADKVDVVVSDDPVPDCPWCLDDRVVGDEREALIEIRHDHGSVHTCRDCLVKAAAVAANESEDGWFHVEITQRSPEYHG